MPIRLTKSAVVKSTAPSGTAILFLSEMMPKTGWANEETTLNAVTRMPASR
jgi:hypothetical protein